MGNKPQNYNNLYLALTKPKINDISEVYSSSYKNILTLSNQSKIVQHALQQVHSKALQYYRYLQKIISNI